MAIKFIKHNTVEELDIDELQEQYQALASRRSREITKVRWEGTAGNPASQVVQEYASRVRLDGGIVEALQCLQNAIYNLMI